MNKLKKIYRDIKLPDKQVEKSWQDLRKRIDVSSGIPYFKFGSVFLSLLFIFLSAIVVFAQTTTPGTTLYPVKILSDQIVAKVSGEPQIPIERRAQDLIEVSKKQPAKVEDASKQYTKALDNVQKETEQNNIKRDKVEDSLDKQEYLFKKAIDENPRSARELKKALENTNKVKEKLKQDSE